MTETDAERWDRRYSERSPSSRGPSSFLLEVVDELPDRGAALDLAGGAGRNALWLAQRGLQVTLCDVSRVALALASSEAQARGLALVTEQRDLEVEPPPAGPWELIVVHDYLNRDLFGRFPDLLASEGMLVYVQPTRRNLERHAHPSARFLLEEGELGRLAEGLDVLRLEEGWSSSGRHEARLLARKRSLDRSFRSRSGGPACSSSYQSYFGFSSRVASSSGWGFS